MAYRRGSARVLDHPFSMGLAAAVAIVALADVTVRLMETRLSGDAAQIRDIPAKLQALEPPAPLRIAALGNSLIGEGLDTDVFSASLQLNGSPPPLLARIQADASNIWDWRCLLKKPENAAFFRANVVIIGYGWDQLTDQVSFRRGSLNNTCSIPAIRATAEVRGRFTLDEWLMILATKTSKLYAQRSALRHNILGRVVPGYQNHTQMLNEASRATPADAEPASSPEHSYRALTALLGRFSEAGTSVLLVAMPVRDPYEIDKGLCEVLQGSPHQLIDMRRSVPPEWTFWQDGIHLNADGARLFSLALAEAHHSQSGEKFLCSG